MKVIIAGGRDFNDMRILAQAIKDSKFKITEVVSGAASGADRLGEYWANANDVPIRRFPAKWKILGRAAGPSRNREMARYADALIALPGGSGTNNMIYEADERELVLWVVSKELCAAMMREHGWTSYE